MPLPSDFFSPESVVTILASLEWKTKSLFVCRSEGLPNDLVLLLRPKDGSADEILMVDRGTLREFAQGLVAKLAN
jgi:hypothetical protein